MEHDNKTTPTAHIIHNPLRQFVGPLDHPSRSPHETRVDQSHPSNSGPSGALGGLSGQPNGSPAHSAPADDPSGQREAAEPPLSESEALANAAREFTTKNRVGTMVEPGQFCGIATDGRTYYDKAADGLWRPVSSVMVSCMIKSLGFTTKTSSGESISPHDRALLTINTHRRVDGAAPFLYHKNEIIEKSGRKFLNISSIRIMRPADEPAPWGENFPLIAAVFDNVFASETYKHLFLAWFQRFYSSGLSGDLVIGQVLALVGPVQCYKSWTIHKILKPTMGGFSDMTNMANGQSGGFNADVLRSPLAVIDDSQGSSSENKRVQYASAIKKLVANGTHMYHEKYQTPTEVEWKGRVILALNDDPVSIRLMPTLDISNEDKVIGCYMKAWPDHPDAVVFDNLETTELPHFLAWLLEWTPPDSVLDSRSRYGIRALVSEEIREKVFAASTTGAVQEKLNEWWSRRTSDERKKPYTGTACAILEELGACFRNSPEQLRGMTQTSLSARLRELACMGDCGVEVVPKSPKSKKSIRYKIFLPWAEAPESGTFDARQ
jgi:hypothetical protein